jgi:hypothetical protein
MGSRDGRWPNRNQTFWFGRRESRAQEQAFAVVYPKKRFKHLALGRAKAKTTGTTPPTTSTQKGRSDLP